ncbi:ankyrin repeat-containing protein BDA1-like [Olea europaea var. sylvestris]|uniref:ankyrin repeat-containing protein BDA1-like n=1 Tax=Olea europaea var. sylvestris TaxID=158386 RepID=UPI000C1D3EC6|nr:ankyrin repeat-containing protein BDA1-like [Olea europaea var. sylvestris]
METMENMLFEAAAEGNVNSLKKLLQEDPIILDRVIVNSYSDTPLHVAAILGHIDFVVKVLLPADPLMCLARDRNGLTPLHLAAIKGWIETVKQLVQANRDAAQVIVGQGQTILHLCVKYYQIEALKHLVNTIRDQDFTNCKDSDGNTILHLTIAVNKLRENLESKTKEKL